MSYGREVRSWYMHETKNLELAVSHFRFIEQQYIFDTPLQN
jgi:hypothetical protein